MRNILILHYSPVGSCESIAKDIREAIEGKHPDMTVRVAPIIHAADRKALTESGIKCDMLFLVFPVYGDNAPAEIIKWLKKTEVNATFASVVCAYGHLNPVVAVKKMKFLLRRKLVPTVSAMDIPVGHVYRDTPSSPPVLPRFDAVRFVEATFQNADNGKHIRISLAEGKDRSTRYFI